MKKNDKKMMLIKVLNKFTSLCPFYIGGGFIILLTVRYLAPDLLPPLENPPECNAGRDLFFISVIFLLLSNLVNISLMMVSALLENNNNSCTMLFYMLVHMVLALPSILTVRLGLRCLSCGSQLFAFGAALSVAMTLAHLYLLSSAFLTYTDMKVEEGKTVMSHRTNVELPLQAEELSLDSDEQTQGPKTRES